MSDREHRYMLAAAAQAEAARRMGEVPVGAVVVREDRVVARGHNRVIRDADPTAHAEIVALRRAGRRSGNYRLTGAEVFVTLEPCLMCYSAMVHARIGRLVYSAADPKTGVFSTGVFERVRGAYNHRIEVKAGILEARSAKRLKEFFIERRDAGAVERDGLENR